MTEADRTPWWLVVLAVVGATACGVLVTGFKDVPRLVVLGLFVVHAMRRWAPAGAGTAIQTLMLPTLGAVLVGALVYGALAAAAPETEHPDMPIGEVVAGGFAGIVTGAVLLGSYLARWRKDDRARSRVGWVLDLCGLGCLLGALVDTWT
ncbi:MAG: hypothetical protein H6712_30290 [Myxococcales bacterium]|nr:hypothetical protein [Myxococcales bacterium]MCB9718178.1 hypothetical protein [Myxococcales bacterium]